MGPPVTVAVVSWNTRDLLDECLRSLEPAVATGLADVWVVDNASSDGSSDMVRHRHPWARLVAHRGNLGFGRAVNLVAAQTDSRWIAAANADVRLEPGALEALVAAGARSPGAGVLAPALRTSTGAVQHSVHPFPTLPRTLAFNLGLPWVGDRLALPGCWDPSRSRNVDWAHGAFLLVRRSAWDAAGGFDEAQWMHAEDLDLGWRMARAGWSTRYEPEAVVVHHVSAAVGQIWGDDGEARAQAAAYAWMVRRRGAVRTRAFAAINVAGAVARSVRRRDRASMLHYARMHAVGLRARGAEPSAPGHGGATAPG